MIENNSTTMFSTKANTIKYFYHKIKKSKIEKFYFFTVNEWNKNRKSILNNIDQKFNGKIVVRSSAIGEDSVVSSQAGKFETIFDIESKNRKDVEKAIVEVIKSYKIKNFKNKHNQILIQNQTLDSITSGVIFTKTLENGSPYYVINYEDGKSTDSVTKGMIANTVKIHNNTEEKIISKKWHRLISAIKEIETISKNNKLDIEFAITRKNIIIFQVRPLTTINNKNEIEIRKYVTNEIKKNKRKIISISKKNNSKIKKNIFSNMSDWNPAEIIGEKPRKLDYSLYDFLIMKNSWNQGRVILDYNDVKFPLMENFSGRPYVNLWASFSSLLPKTIDKKLRKKLLKYFFNKLENKPHLHDKVEFDILFSCYDFTMEKRMKDLLKHGFSQNEIKLLKKQLKAFTNQLISQTPKIIEITKENLVILEDKRQRTNLKANNYQTKLTAAEELLTSCKKYGAIQFSAIARIAFVANILLKGITDISKIKKSEIEKFMNSISTSVTEFQEDLTLLNQEKISQKEFLVKYGHLRPGTYDITVQRYDKMPNFLQNFEFIDFKKIISRKKFSEKEIEKILEKHELYFREINFIDFITKTISLREKTKFEFTKSLSDAIELIADAGNELGFSREELSHLSISDILKFKSFNRKEIKKMWRKKISYNKINYFKNEFVELPPIIFSQNDFSIIPHYISKPNFITKKKVVSNVKLLEEVQDISEITSNVILIENADPGFDWIFAKKPSGLITKYGGVASHMSIRCAELGLPAAIGCGENWYRKLTNSEKINLNCKDKDIFIIEYKHKKDFSEERKILKSLGYIR